MLEVFKKRKNVTLSDMIYCSDRHGLMVRLEDLSALPKLMILWFYELSNSLS